MHSVTIKQRNNECIVTRMLVNKKSCSRTKFLFKYRIIFNSKFLFETELFKFQDVRKPRFDCISKFVEYNKFSFCNTKNSLALEFALTVCFAF